MTRRYVVNITHSFRNNFSKHSFSFFVNIKDANENVPMLLNEISCI